MNIAATDMSNDKKLIEQKKKEIMTNIKSLQRDLIKASFRPSSSPISYGDILKAINAEREKIKQLNG